MSAKPLGGGKEHSLVFWNLRKLRESLTGPLPPREQVSYLVGIFVIWGLPIPTAIALGSASQDGLASDLAALGISLVGVLHAYRSNGGSSGEEFAVRLIAVGWVVGVRFTVTLAGLSLLAIYPGLPVAIEIASKFNVEIEPNQNSAAVVLVYTALAVQALYWWVVGRQMRSIHAAA